jgi:hypothetical protein
MYIHDINKSSAIQYIKTNVVLASGTTNKKATV